MIDKVWYISYIKSIAHDFTANSYLDISWLKSNGTHRFPPVPTLPSCGTTATGHRSPPLLRSGSQLDSLVSCHMPRFLVGESKTKHPNGGNISWTTKGDSLYPFFSVVLYLYNILLLIIVDSKSPMPGWLCIKLLLVAAAKLSHADFSIHINTPCVFWLPRTYDGSTSLLLAINSRLL